MIAVTDSESEESEITVADGDSGPVAFPAVEILTGRGAIFGKSGSGKSNTASVVAEQLLDQGHPLLIVDTDGEYYGLKEEFEILHAGADEECDIQVGPEHGERLAELALEEGVPIILDVSAFLEDATAKELVRETARHLFSKEKRLKQPFVMLVEEVHEYIPQQGSLDDCGQQLIQVAKRGRKHGLGIVGISQRPADVKKDFVTQADWLVWHRLTWENDLKTARRVLGGDYADRLGDLDDGEAFVQRDWSDVDVGELQFRRKRTFDAGATPGLEDVERPELKSLDEDLLEELDEISDQHQRRQSRIDELEAENEALREEIADLEEDLQQAEDMSDMAEQFTAALLEHNGDDDGGDVQQTIEAEVMEVREAKREAEAEIEDLQEELAGRGERIDELESEVERLRGVEERIDQAEEIEEQLADIKSWFASAPPTLRESAQAAGELFEEYGDIADADGVEEALVEDYDEAREELQELRARLQDAHERADDLEAENERLRKEATSSDHSGDDLDSLLRHEAVRAAIDTAKEDGKTAGEHFDSVLSVLATADGRALSVSEMAAPLDVSDRTVRRAAKALHSAGVVQTAGSQPTTYKLDREFIEQRIEVAEKQAELAAGGVDG